jgi:hypothetical protein
MRAEGLQGVTRRRRRGSTRRDATAVPNDDLVARQFTPDAPDRLWVADITEHPTDEGRVYVAVVIDAWNRKSSATPSPTTSAPSSSSTPWTWPAGGAGLQPVIPSTTPTTAPSPAPGNELAQIQGVRLASQTPIASEKRSERVALGIRELRSMTTTSVDGLVVVTWHLQVRLRPGGRSRPAPANVESANVRTICGGGQRRLAPGPKHLPPILARTVTMRRAVAPVGRRLAGLFAVPLLVFRAARGEAQLESGAAEWRVADSDGAAVSCDDVAGDGEAESGAAGASGA